MNKPKKTTDFILYDIIVELNVSKIANIHYLEFTANSHTREDRHNFYELIFVCSGEVNVESDTYNGILLKNTLLIHNPNEYHWLSINSSNVPEIIIIGFECNDAVLSKITSKPIILNAESQKILSLVVKEGRNTFLPPYDIPTSEMKKRSVYPFGSNQLIKNYLEQLFIRLIRETTRENPTIENEQVITDTLILEVCEFLSENFKRKITIKELCLLFGVNKTTLCVTFKNQTGTTIMQYLNDLKIREAKRLLRENRLNVTQIAETLGFNSIHHLSKMFKEYVKLTPKEYATSLKVKFKENF